MNTNVYQLTMNGRVFTARFIENPKEVRIQITCSEYGVFGDEEAFANWLEPILKTYDSDPRPIVMDHPLTGERMTIVGDAKQGIGLYQRPRDTMK